MGLSPSLEAGDDIYHFLFLEIDQIVSEMPLQPNGLIGIAVPYDLSHPLKETIDYCKGIPLG